MNTYPANEVLISATRVAFSGMPDVYEFVLDSHLQITECAHVSSLVNGLVYPLHDFQTILHNVLFELNHVRVNPHLDNTFIISCLTNALQDIGVKIHNPPSQNSMKICYRPLGEITENVRFYFTDSGHCIFLCPNAKLKAIPGLLKHYNQFKR